jgi:hypothetical protein
MLHIGKNVSKFENCTQQTLKKAEFICTFVNVVYVPETLHINKNVSKLENCIEVNIKIAGFIHACVSLVYEPHTD